MERWYHEVDAGWLEARRHYLTATEIAKLVPEYKRAIKGDPDAIAPGFAALWAEKNSDTKVDPVSVGAAARGHWMEPYAVDEWCMQRGIPMYHWDDCLITRDGVGFSPDGMDVMQTMPEDVVLSAHDHYLWAQGGAYDYQPDHILEVKSYEPAHHMKCVIKDRMEQEQLMQIAVAFHVIEDLKKASLVFFCPGAPVSMKDFEYSREDLGKEIELVGKISEMYSKTASQCEEITVDLVANVTEEEVHRAMVEEVELNRKDEIFRF